MAHKINCIENAHGSYIRDISWSFDMTKMYHQIATCSEDKTFKIWELDYQFKEIKSHEIKKDNPVWKVSWNFMGNLLAVSFDNEHKKECVGVYYQNNDGDWISDLMSSQ